jgi:hypothetical protein
MRNIKTAVFASTILLAASSVSAHDSSSMPGMNMPGMRMDNMMGMHDMAATVNAVDAKTGLVDVTAGGLALKLHFPPASLVNVKMGDSITVHLAFTKP